MLTNLKSRSGKLLTLVAALSFGALLATPALADHWSVGVGVGPCGPVVGGFTYRGSNATVAVGTGFCSGPVYAPRPVYVAPAPVIVAPAPVYVAPAPVVYTPAPVVYTAPAVVAPAPVVYTAPTVVAPAPVVYAAPAVVAPAPVVYTAPVYAPAPAFFNFSYRSGGGDHHGR